MGELKSAFAQHLQRQGKSAATINTRIDAIERMARTIRPLLDATTAVLADYLYSTDDWSQAYRRSIRASIIAFYAWAHATDRIHSNPAASLPQISASNARLPALPTQVMLDGLRDATVTERAIIALSATEGLRRSEIACVHPRDRQDRWLTVHGKGRKERRVPLNKTTLELLLMLEQEQGTTSYYFPGRYGPDTHLHPATIYKWWKRRIPNWSLHSGRHRTATIGVRTVGNIRAVQELLGHASISTTQTYIDVDARELQAIAEATDAATTRGAGRIAGNPHINRHGDDTLVIHLESVTEEQISAVLLAYNARRQRNDTASTDG